MIDYLKQGQIINGAYYAAELRWYARKLQERDQEN